MKLPALLALSLFAFFFTPFAARADTLIARAESGGAIDLSIHPSATATLASAAPADKQAQSATDVSTDAKSTASTQAPDVNFDLPVASNTAVPSASSPPTSAVAPAKIQANLFTGGSDSLVARTVGHAEGTRTSNGNRTRAYYGHVDPGNGVWNVGSFSYQHGAKSPEEADEKQLQRLQGQADVIRQKADSQRLDLSLEEELNAIDLANQAPLAALATPGYVDRLKQARDRGLTGSEAVLWARTQSYWNPQLNRWDAPGLGNTETNISHDQNRRQTAIAQALNDYQQQMARRKEDEPQEKVADQPPPNGADAVSAEGLSQSKTNAIAQADH